MAKFHVRYGTWTYQRLRQKTHDPRTQSRAILTLKKKLFEAVHQSVLFREKLALFHMCIHHGGIHLPRNIRHCLRRTEEKFNYAADAYTGASANVG